MRGGERAQRDPFYASLAHARTAVGHASLDRQAPLRSLGYAREALAQLHQGDVDQACATASAVFELMDGDPLPGRLRSLLGDYYRDLIALAPDAAVSREWGDRIRSEGNRA